MDCLLKLNKLVDRKQEMLEQNSKLEGRIPKIKCIEEYISSNLEEDSNYSSIVIENEDIITDQKETILQIASIPTPALMLYKSSLRNCRPLPTGYPDLDAFLNGGIFPGELTDVVGGTASGKTQLLHSIAISTVYTDVSNITCLYMDNNGSYCPWRAVQILQNKLNYLNSSGSREDGNEDLIKEDNKVEAINSATINELLKKINYMNLSDPYLLLPTLKRLLARVECKADRFYSSLKIVLIDNFSMHYSALSSGYTHEGLIVCTQISKLLRHLATIHNIAVVFTNRAPSNFTPAQTDVPLKYISLGQNWMSIPSNRYLMQKVSLKKCMLTVLKSDSIPYGNQLEINMF